MDTKVVLENGKYTFGIESATGRVYCLRFGEKWIEDFDSGGKAIMSLIYHCYHLAERVKDLEYSIDYDPIVDNFDDSDYYKGG